MSRFQRQILLQPIGESGQQFLSKSKVLVIGAGGLGHPVLQYVAAMGVGTIGIVDGDSVQESNLHRQILFQDRDVGKNKAAVAAAKIKGLSPDSEIHAYEHYLNKATAIDLFPKYDVVVDGTDNFACKFLINDICSIFNIPMVYGAISQFEGQVAVFWRGHGPCYRCLVPEIPKAQIQNCAEAGVVGALPGVIGSMQAIEVLKVLMRMNDKNNSLVPLVGKIQFLDFLNNETRTMNLRTRSNCICQSKNLDLSSVLDISLPSCALYEKEQLLDVREQNEWNQYHIDGSLHWPLSLIEQGQYPVELRNRKMVLICKSGIRAEKAYSVLKEKGFQNFTFTKGGVDGYQAR